MKRAASIPTFGVILFAATSAHADRSTVLTLGATMNATSYANDTANDPHLTGGLRATLAFEDAPIELPPPGLLDTSARLVPELLAGFHSDDVRAEGFIGAGLRAELQLARQSAEPGRFKMRFGFYGAARAKIVGKHQDGGAEFVIGEYILLRGATRFGWEGGLGIVKRTEVSAEQSPQLEALLTIYMGWAL